jgi:hypothetical protein
MIQNKIKLDRPVSDKKKIFNAFEKDVKLNHINRKMKRNTLMKICQITMRHMIQERLKPLKLYKLTYAMDPLTYAISLNLFRSAPSQLILKTLGFF